MFMCVAWLWLQSYTKKKTVWYVIFDGLAWDGWCRSSAHFPPIWGGIGLIQRQLVSIKGNPVVLTSWLDCSLIKPHTWTFLSPPVQFTRWAHVHTRDGPILVSVSEISACLSVRLSDVRTGPKIGDKYTNPANPVRNFCKQKLRPLP